MSAVVKAGPDALQCFDVQVSASARAPQADSASWIVPEGVRQVLERMEPVMSAALKPLVSHLQHFSQTRSCNWDWQ